MSLLTHSCCTSLTMSALFHYFIRFFPVFPYTLHFIFYSLQFYFTSLLNHATHAHLLLMFSLSYGIFRYYLSPFFVESSAAAVNYTRWLEGSDMVALATHSRPRCVAYSFYCAVHTFKRCILFGWFAPIMCNDFLSVRGLVNFLAV